MLDLYKFVIICAQGSCHPSSLVGGGVRSGYSVDPRVTHGEGTLLSVHGLKFNPYSGQQQQLHTQTHAMMI